MHGDNSQGMDSQRAGVSRRRFVRGVGATGAAASSVSLAGCTAAPWGSSDDDDVPDGAEDYETVITWHGGFADDESDDVKDDVREALWEAGLSEDIYVDIQQSSESTDDVLDQYTTWLSAGRSDPDILNMDSGWTIPFIERGQLGRIDEYMSDDQIAEIEEDYFPASVDSVRDEDGNLHGLPVFVDLGLMHYRKDLVEAAGYDPDGEGWATEPPTWQEFSEAVSAAMEEDDEIEQGFTFQADNYEGLSCCNFNEWITTWGGAYFGDHENLHANVGDRPITVEDEPVLDAIRMIRTFVHGSDADDTLDDFEGGISPEAVLGWNEDPSLGPYGDGRVIANRNWSYAAAMHAQDDDEDGAGFGEDHGVMPIPYAVTEDEAEYEGTGGTAAALGGWNAVPNPNSENLDAVGEVLDALMDPDFQLFIFEHPLIGNIPPRSEALEDDDAEEIPVMGRYVDSIRVAGETATARPVTSLWPDQSSVTASHVHSALQGDETPADAMSNLTDDLEQLEQEEN